MGNSFCLPSYRLKEEKERKPSFLENHNMEAILRKTKSKVLKEDKEHFFENEEWFQDLISQNNNKTFLNLPLFLETYKHYKLDQVSDF